MTNPRSGGPKVVVRPCELKDANAFVEAMHRHHKPATGHRFSLKALVGEKVVGVCIVGRPVARMIDASQVLEVTRLCTDGTPNACSALYAAAARVGRELGYESIQTYTLPSEGGHSLKASGWACEGEAGGGQWKHTDGKERYVGHPTETKWRWRKVLRTEGATK